MLAAYFSLKKNQVGFKLKLIGSEEDIISNFELTVSD